ncbi:cupin domain-containing protein [Tomitella biformata]|uniref:cupin domain-containing protein n=1 Tax=Tomitella biformata TaxID=630403 RepID=UPI000466EFEC|nr:cupin domain-containing protein [Tomitella biformata]
MRPPIHARRAATMACAIACAIVSAALTPAIASATPSSGVTAEVIGAITVPDVATVTLRHIAIAPGGATGWHYHQGPVYALITAGTLTRTLQDCTVVDSSAGQVVEESHGADHPHIGANNGATSAELWTVYVEPAGAPLSDDAPAVDCS